MKSGFDRIGRSVTVEHATRSCLDKVRYPSRNAARDRATKLAAKYPNSRPTKPYRCTLCDGFHLTSIRQESNPEPTKTKRLGAAS